MNFSVESRILFILINDWRSMIYIEIVLSENDIYHYLTSPPEAQCHKTK